MQRCWEAKRKAGKSRVRVKVRVWSHCIIYLCTHMLTHSHTCACTCTYYCRLTHTCSHLYTCTHKHRFMHIHAHMWNMYTHAHISRGSYTFMLKLITHIYIHHTRVYTCICEHGLMHIHAHTLYIHVHAYAFESTCAYTYTCFHIHKCTFKYTHVCTYTHAHMSIYLGICTHMQTCKVAMQDIWQCFFLVFSQISLRAFVMNSDRVKICPRPICTVPNGLIVTQLQQYFIFFKYWEQTQGLMHAT